MRKLKPYKEIKPFKERRKPKFEHPDGTIIYGTILDEIEVKHICVGKHKGKIYKYLVQEILYKANDILGDIKKEFRFCYYMIDLNSKKPYFIFGQYALTITKAEFKDLLNKMKEKKWI